MTTLTVSATHDYSAENISGTTAIQFDNGKFDGPATATFLNTQLISNLALAASAGTNNLVVNGGSINASDWAFTSWNALADHIALNGGNTADTIIGSLQNDTITGGLGGDSLQGGDGDDVFIIGQADVGSGEIIDGGSGSGDTLRLSTDIGGGAYTVPDFTTVLFNVEKLVFTGLGAGTFSSDQFGTASGRINSITGNSDFNEIFVNGNNVDLSTISFLSWTAGVDDIGINGTSGNDTLKGSSQDERFTLAGGADSCLGGAGNDKFVANDISTAAADTIDGGDGAGDSISVRSANANIAVLTLSGIERLVFEATSNASATATGAQIRDTAIATIVGGLTADQLTITGASVDLSGVAFTSWSGADISDISGSDGAASTLTGSDQIDSITGGSLDDIIKGGAGADIINGADGNGDTADYSDKTQAVEVALNFGSAVTVKVNGVAEDTIQNVEYLIGGSAGDRLTGDIFGNSLAGGGGDDTFKGGRGADSIDGGAGSGDTAEFTGSWLQYTIGLASGTHSVADDALNRDGTDTVRNVETFVFSNGSFAASAIVNDAPIGANDTNATDAVIAGTDGSAAGNVLSNDTDQDTSLGDSKLVIGLRTGTEIAGGTLSNIGAIGTVNGAHGSLSLSADGTYTYTLNDDDPAAQALAIGQVIRDTFTYSVLDAKGLADTAQLTIAIAGSNATPVITNNGGDTASAITVAENSTAVTTVTSSDVGSVVTYTITGGTDAGRFQIDSSSGALSFIAAPDFEVPTDAGGNNVYDVIVRASNGSLTDTQSIAVTVTNIAGHTIKGNKTKADTINGTKPAGNATTNEEDKINGRGGNDTIKALGGNDTVKGGLGKDVLDGGTGRDTVDFSDMTKAVELTLKGNKASSAKVGGVAEDALKKFESIIGGKAGDKLSGDSKDNLLSGLAGNDTLKGSAGFDTINGGKGADKLSGGADIDVFLFTTKLGSGNIDAITDFKHGTDALALDDAIFVAIGSTLEAGEFFAKAGATKAHDADDRLIYNRTTGDLYYDADGKGGAAAVLFATLTNHPGGVGGGDFLIV